MRVTLIFWLRWRSTRTFNNQGSRVSSVPCWNKFIGISWIPVWNCLIMSTRMDKALGLVLLNLRQSNFNGKSQSLIPNESCVNHTPPLYHIIGYVSHYIPPKKTPLSQWPFQEPKLEVPIPYIRPIFQAYFFREYTPKIWPKIWYVYVPPF